MASGCQKWKVHSAFISFILSVIFYALIHINWIEHSCWCKEALTLWELSNEVFSACCTICCKPCISIDFWMIACKKELCSSMQMQISWSLIWATFMIQLILLMIWHVFECMFWHSFHNQVRKNRTWLYMTRKLAKWLPSELTEPEGAENLQRECHAPHKAELEINAEWYHFFSPCG